MYWSDKRLSNRRRCLSTFLAWLIFFVKETVVFFEMPWKIGARSHSACLASYCPYTVRQDIHSLFGFGLWLCLLMIHFVSWRFNSRRRRLAGRSPYTDGLDSRLHFSPTIKKEKKERGRNQPPTVAHTTTKTKEIETRAAAAVKIKHGERVAEPRMSSW